MSNYNEKNLNLEENQVGLLNNQEIKNYISKVNKVKNQLDDNYKKVKELEKKLNKQIIEIDNKYSQSEAKEKKQLVVINFLKESAKNNIIKKDIVFFNTSKDLFTKIAKGTKVIDGVEKTFREAKTVSKEAIKRLFNSVAKKKIDDILPTAKLNALVEWLNDYDKTFDPNAPKLFRDYYNIYDPCGFLEVEVKNIYDLNFFYDEVLTNKYPHIKALIANLAPKREEQLYILNWLSTILNTKLKLRNCIAFIGAEGTGKGVLQQIIEQILKIENCYTITNSDIQSDFNSFLEDKLFYFLNETKGDFSKSSTQADKIKPIITDSTISINPKNEKQYQVDNFGNCMLFSNHLMPVAMGTNDRRYSTIETSHTKLVAVAREQFDLTIDEYIKKAFEEIESFAIELKAIKYDIELAKSLIENELKEKIQEGTNTQKDILKEKIANRDTKWFKDKLDDLMESKANDAIVEKYEKRIIKNDVGDRREHKEPIPYKETNQEMQEIFLTEVEQGVFTNHTLRWFSVFYELDNINLDSKRKFGEFWNNVISKSSDPININKFESKTIKLRFIDKNHTKALINIKNNEYSFNEAFTTLLKVENVF